MPDLVAAKEQSREDALESMLARAGAKDRTTLQKHLAALDAEEDGAHAALWRRLAGKLAAMAPLPVQTSAHAAVLFFIPDGKYRMQVFALEDQRDGRIALYVPDILAEAVRRKLIRRGAGPDEYVSVGNSRTTLHVELLDAQNTPEPLPHVKNMLGWNRKALRVTIPTLSADRHRVETAEALCALAAKHFPKAAG